MNTTPRPTRPLLGVLLVSAVVLAASPARADDTPRIFPLVTTSPLAPELGEAPETMANALATLLGGVTTDRSLEDFGKKLRCDIEMTSCLDAIARALVTSRLVYGTVAPTDDGKIKVKLVRFDSAQAGSEMHRRTFTLTARTPKRLGKQLVRSAAQMFDLQPPSEEVVQPARLERPAPRGEPKSAEPKSAEPKQAQVEPTETESDDPDVKLIEEPAPTESGERTGGRITSSTWAILGSGALGVVVGGGFLIAAHSLRSDLDRAPRETVADFRRLTEIERAGRIRSQVGSTLVVAGGVALVAGAVRAYLQHGGGRKSESMERSVAIVPVQGGGAALVFSGGLR